ncbi:MAG: hypothetical protein N3D20_00550 [Candidatus Pacearchaeota archaeon]|nr:hypothetical protein [Candidatus Pacearchaeota archaeon]
MVSVIICPNCESDNVDLTYVGLLGNHKCNSCGFEGIFPEVEINYNVKINKDKEIK